MYHNNIIEDRVYCNNIWKKSVCEWSSMKINFPFKKTNNLEQVKNILTHLSCSGSL